MLSTLLDEMLDFLEEVKADEVKIFKQVEPYEGQFDNISEYLLVPPTAFVELTEGNSNSQGRKGTTVNYLSIYITTNHIKGLQPGNMLNIIDKLRAEFHSNTMAHGYLKFESYNRLANFPGFITYELKLTHTED